MPFIAEAPSGPWAALLQLTVEYLNIYTIQDCLNGGGAGAPPARAGFDRGMGTMKSKLSAPARGGRAAIALLLLATLTGCGTPTIMHVRAGSDPKYADDGVRFRTTYYFRVVDYCNYDANGVVKDGEKKPIRIDSLYRYTMTGKAGGLFNRTFFEAGTLKEHEISPFGRTVRQGEDGQIELKAVKTASTPDSSNRPTEECKAGNGQRGRGFQIHGPAGWQSFDQSERLLLVMSSDSKPLIGALKAASDRIMTYKLRQAEASDTLPLLVLERKRARDAGALIDVNAADTKPEVQKAIDALSKETP